MPIAVFPLSLRRVLLADAITCAAMGALLTAAAGPLSTMTRIPESLLLYAGIILFPVALFMSVVGLRRPLNRPAVGIVVAGNLGWIAASLALFGFLSPNMLGVIFILAQAAAVALLSWLELGGSAHARRTRKADRLIPNPTTRRRT